MKLNHGFNKSLLITAGLLLALTSCGKSKDLKTPPNAAVAPTAEPVSTPEKTPAKKPPTATPVPTKPPTPTTAPPAKGHTRSTEPFDNIDDEEMDGPNDLIPNAAESTVNNSPVTESEETEILPPLPSSPHQSEGEDSSVLNPPLRPVQNERRAYEVNFTNQTAIKTGGKSQDLFYTGSGRDGILEEFKSYATKVSKEQQVMNVNLAKAIVTAKLSRKSSSGEIAINLNFNEFGAVKTYRLSATSAGDMMNLALSKSGTTGAMAFQGGFIKCLDADGGCESAYAKVKFAGGYARIIFRNSLADMHFQYEDHVQSNPGFSKWLNYVINSANSETAPQTFDTLQLASFEVVNGRAGMGALLTTNDREMIGLSIPLVVSGEKSDVQANVARLSDLSANFDLSSQASKYSQNLSKAVSNVKLIKNNGAGAIKLNFSFAGASIWLVAARVQKETLSLSKIRQFEDKLKKF